MSKFDDISKRNTEAALNEIGVSGLNRDAAGYVFEEFLPQLSMEKGIETFQEMRDNDPIIGGILFGIDMLVRSVDWRVEPYENEPSQADEAEFVMQCMEDMSHTWDDFISEVFSMVVFGWSWFEIVYKKRNGYIKGSPGKSSRFDDGKIGWRKLPLRAQPTKHKWIFDEKGGIKGMVQQAPPDYNMVPIPIERSLLFKTQSFKNNPEGRSVLRNAYRPWYFKKRIEEIEGIGMERDLAGLPVAWVDPKIMANDASPEERAFLEAIKQMVINVRRDAQEGMVFPRAYDTNGNLLYDFQLLTSGGNRQFDTNAIIDRYNQMIATTVMADFILLGQNGGGSFALGSSKANMFAMALGTWLDAVAQVLNKHAIPRLFAVNGLDTEKIPKITYRPVAAHDLAEIAQYIVQLTGAGSEMFPDERLEDYVRQIAGLPAPLPKEARQQAREERAEEEKKITEINPPVQGPGAFGGNLNPRGGKKTGPSGEKLNPQPRSPGSRGSGARNPGLKPTAGA